MKGLLNRWQGNSLCVNHYGDVPPVYEWAREDVASEGAFFLNIAPPGDASPAGCCFVVCDQHSEMQWQLWAKVTFKVLRLWLDSVRVGNLGEEIKQVLFADLEEVT